MSELEDFYAKFEATFRGSRELISERLRAYIPLLAELERRSVAPWLAIDYGCGRGEWVQLLSERGWNALGVDSNESMLQEARALGLRVEFRQMIEHIADVPTESISLISAFHVVEHISHETLIAFVRESLRTLVAGGVLILETPNPENLTVGASAFYVDPTHLRPVPPALLTFYVQHAGFGGNQTIRLNGEPGNGDVMTLENVIRPMFTRAPDYAVVAIKGSDPQRLSEIAALSQQMRQDTPVDLEALHALSEGLRTSLIRLEEVSQATKPLRAALKLGRRLRSALEAVTKKSQG